MKKVLILLAGLPGTGKTYLSNIIKKELGDFSMISQDVLKEQLCDKYGYYNLEEKKEIEKLAWGKYYDLVEQNMKRLNNIISDYPFSNKQKVHLEKLIKTYDYLTITIRLVGDLDVLFERQKERDLDSSRHLSHIVTSYQKGDILVDRSKADNLLSYKEFVNRCTTRGYETFELGKLFELDVTDYSKVNYSLLIEDLKEFVG